MSFIPQCKADEEAKVIETADGPIIIRSNGSKWAGQEPDGLDELHKALASYHLDIERFAAMGFIDFSPNGETVRLFGNFLNVSHVFNIEGPSSQLGRTVDAIKDNITRQMREDGKAFSFPPQKEAR
jgi:hypothetical protein